MAAAYISASMVGHHRSGLCHSQLITESLISAAFCVCTMASMVCGQWYGSAMAASW